MAAAVESRVLLIDVENAVGVAGTPRPAARARVEALLAAAGPVHHAVAAYAARGDLADDPLASHLAELRIGAVAVEPAADAAELVLLAHARRVHTTLGCREFVVASADHRFSRLAEWGAVEVVAWQDQPIATRLEEVARRVHRVARPDHLGPVAAPTRQGAAPSRPAATRLGAYPQVVVTALAAGIGLGFGWRLVDVLLPPRR